jgi:protein gp37
MAETLIEWADRVWNFLRGCSMVSEGCRHCYAMIMAHRFSGPGQAYEGLTELGPKGPRWNGKIRVVEEKIPEPLQVRKPQRWFVNSMSDLFHEDVPFEVIDRAFAVMALTPRHTYQILTKRPWRMREYCSLDWRNQLVAQHTQTMRMVPWPLPNVWLGVSVENQDALSRVDALKDTPAAVRFISIEPLLEDLGALILDGIHWVIVGGESGRGARLMDPKWARSIRDQCVRQNVNFFFKQWGAWVPVYADPPDEPATHELRTIDGAPVMLKVGKHQAGRLIDGREWNEYPEVVA